jgi:hypothetical protein
MIADGRIQIQIRIRLRTTFSGSVSWRPNNLRIRTTTVKYSYGPELAAACGLLLDLTALAVILLVPRHLLHLEAGLEKTRFF